ncbi:MAG TPA: PilZ domain-containing protein [Terracidiphilus sp.]|nr:PilZ domain-containing protein [Terracidiphilus sp.]
MSILRNLLLKAGLSERRKDGRLPAHGLEVSYWTGLEQKRVKVKDISATGIFLLTEDRWVPGAVVQLTMQKRGVLDRDSRLQVRLRARCVRLGDDGVGLTFVEEPARSAEWSRSMANAANLLAANHPIRLFRATKALAFLFRISPCAEAQILQFIGEISVERAEHVIEVALQAEELETARKPMPVDISPILLLRILDFGSRSSDARTQQCWAGILASSCLAETPDDATGRFVLMLSKLDRDHIGILTAACTRAMNSGWQEGFVFSSVLYCNLHEISTITGIRNPVAIERNLNHLHQLGLLEKTIRPLGCAELDEVNITPTSFGLQLYARCCGDSEMPQALERPALELAS